VYPRTKLEIGLTVRGCFDSGEDATMLGGN